MQHTRFTGIKSILSLSTIVAALVLSGCAEDEPTPTETAATFLCACEQDLKKSEGVIWTQKNFDDCVAELTPMFSKGPNTCVDCVAAASTRAKGKPVLAECGAAFECKTCGDN